MRYVFSDNEQNLFANWLLLLTTLHSSQNMQNINVLEEIVDFGSYLRERERERERERDDDHHDDDDVLTSKM